jgi:hypothetical protein
MALPRKLSDLDKHFLIDGVKTTGLKEDPDEPLIVHGESMTSDQYKYLRAFLAWVIAGGKVQDEHVPSYQRHARCFGHGNIQDRWAEFLADQEKPAAAPAAAVIGPAPDSWELHLSPNTEFTSKGWGKKVKAAGGSFSTARGSVSNRFVHLPNTDAGYSLADQLIKTFGSGKVCVIARFKQHISWPAWVAVQYTRRDVENPMKGIEAAYQKAYRQAVAREIIKV